MRHGWLGPAVVVLTLAPTGCTATVQGTGVAAPPAAPVTSNGPAAPSGPAAPRSGLDVDVIADECLLNAAEFGALVGAAVQPPEQGIVSRADGSSSVSCVATTGTEPVAIINVYTVRTGSPADFVRAEDPGGRRELVGVGEAAALVDTQSGPTLQLASARYLVTVQVAGRIPSDDSWRAAATAALSRLPE